MEIDARAKKILFDMHWSSSGWKTPAQMPTEVDYQYAKLKGYLFDDKVISHRSLVSIFRKSVKKSHLKKLSDFFISSLSERNLHIRPGLPAYFEASKIKWHLFSPNKMNMCESCRMFKQNKTRYNAWNFARYKWGAYDKNNTSLQNPFILNVLMKQPEVSPKKEDWDIFKKLIETLMNGNETVKAIDVVDQWKVIIPSNQQERRMLFESFISIGIIAPSRVTQQDYHAIPMKTHWSDEAALWRGDDLPNADIISAVFSTNGVA